MRQRGTGAVIIAGILIIIGVIALLNNLNITSLDWGFIWPVILIALGVFLIWRRSAHRHEPQVEHVVGDIRMEQEGWALRDQHVESGVGSVRIDLTKAQIPSKETMLSIESWIGNIEVVVPADLALSASGRVTLGSVTLLGDKSDGFVRTLDFKSPDYDTVEKKVRLYASIVIGEIKVMRAGQEAGK